MTSDAATRTTTNAIIYCRVSDPKQVTRGSGLGSQETRCRDYARAKGYDVVDVFRDEGASGSLIGRPGMITMLAFLKKHRRTETHIVIIDDISRLARGLEAHIQLRTAIAAAGGKLESPSIEFGEDSDSLLVENLLASVSQHQRQKNAEQTKNRMQARISNGYWGFSPPIGYRFARVAGHSGKVLIPDEPIAGIIKEALEGFASGHFQTQADVQRFLQAHTLFPKNRKGEVHSQRVASILTQVMYAGFITVAEWGIYRLPAKHQALISFDAFTRIQERMTGKTATVAPMRSDADTAFPLRGFVVCGCCGHAMTAAWSKGKGGRYGYYSCFQKSCADGRKSIRKEKIEGAFSDLLDAIKPSQETLFAARAMFKEIWDTRDVLTKERAEKATREIALVERKIEQLLERIVETDNRALIKTYEGQINKLQDRKHLLAEQTRFMRSPRKPFEESFRTAFQFVENPRILWDSRNTEHHKKLFRLTFAERIAYSREDGLRTPQTTLPFKALRAVLGGENGVARPKGFEPLTLRFVV